MLVPVIKKINNISIAHVRGEQLKRISYKNCKRFYVKLKRILICFSSMWDMILVFNFSVSAIDLYFMLRN